MRDMRISLNHDTLEYELEEVVQGSLKTYSTSLRNHDMVTYGKWLIETSPNGPCPGDRIINTCGTIYEYQAGGKWKTIKPNK